jgi:hypothetical protein
MALRNSKSIGSSGTANARRYLSLLDDIINTAFHRHELVRWFNFEHPGCSGAGYGLLSSLAA